MKICTANDFKQYIPFPGRLFEHPGWVGHIPIVSYLSELLKPSIYVELGSFSGNSFFAFCQAFRELHLDTQCFAIDIWEGSNINGNYSDEIYSDVTKFRQKYFPDKTFLLKMTFDDALGKFENKSIDLLHIDGLHTYDAVKHDFETWLPKLSDKGVIIFHDTQENKEPEFGVWRFWKEIKNLFPSFEFTHSHGLGILVTGKNPPVEILEFIEKANKDNSVQEIFEKAGTELLANFQLMHRIHQLEIYNKQLKNTLQQVQRSYSFILGNNLLKPVRYIKNIFHTK
jgi:hypothetical protein